MDTLLKLYLLSFNRVFVSALIEITASLKSRLIFIMQYHYKEFIKTMHSIVNTLYI